MSHMELRQQDALGQAAILACTPCAAAAMTGLHVVGCRRTGMPSLLSVPHNAGTSPVHFFVRNLAVPGH